MNLDMMNVCKNGKILSKISKNYIIKLKIKYICTLEDLKITQLNSSINEHIRCQPN